MTKAELIDALAAQADITKSCAGKVLDAFAAVVADTLKTGEQVVLPGIGKLDLTHRKARVGRNPQTGADVQIAASTGVKFKASKALKDAVA